VTVTRAAIISDADASRACRMQSARRMSDNVELAGTHLNTRKKEWCGVSWAANHYVRGTPALWRFGLRGARGALQAGEA
jgi:hypothetical protein